MLICHEDTSHCTEDYLAKNGLKQAVPDVEEMIFWNLQISQGLSVGFTEVIWRQKCKKPIWDIIKIWETYPTEWEGKL